MNLKTPTGPNSALIDSKATWKTLPLGIHTKLFISEGQGTIQPSSKKVIEELLQKAPLVETGMEGFSKAEVLAMNVLKERGLF